MDADFFYGASGIFGDARTANPAGNPTWREEERMLEERYEEPEPEDEGDEGEEGSEA